MITLRTSDRKRSKPRTSVWRIDTSNVEIAKAGAIQRHEMRYETGDVSAIEVSIITTEEEPCR